MRAEIAVGGTKHIEEITGARAQRFAHSDVVFEDLARRGWNVRWTVEEVFDDVVSEW